MKKPNNKNIAIIGGGYSGLSAAHEFIKKGYTVQIYEAAPFLGGLASTFDIGEAQVEKFYHHLFLSDQHLIDLLKEFDLDQHIIWKNSSTSYFYDGKIYPFTTPLDLLKFSPVNLINRIRMGLLALYLQRVKKWEKYEKITAADYMKKYAGSQNYKIIWEPLLKGKFSDYYEDVSMSWLWSKFATRVASRDKTLQEQLGYIEGSWDILTNALAQYIINKGSTIHLQTRVTKIHVENNKVIGLDTVDSLGNTERQNFDVILSTIPTFYLPNLIEELPDDYKKRLTDIQYEGAIAAVWFLNKPLSNSYWINISDPNIPFLLALEHTNLFNSDLYNGNHILYTADYVTQTDPRWQIDDENIINSYIPHLQKINPSFDRSWINKTYIHKERAAQPVVTLNYSEKIPNTKSPIDGLWLAAMSQVYPQDRGTNYSIGLGKKVAEDIINK